MKKLLLASLVLCLFFFGGAPLAFAGQTDPEAPTDPIAKLESEGWVPVMQGVMKRDRGDGRIESIAFGSEGYAWVKEQLQGQLDRMQQAYAVQPTKQLERTIRKHIRQIEKVERALESGELSASLEKYSTTTNGCTVWWDARANAYPLNAGAGADANAYLNANCGYTGSTYAYTYAEATSGTVPTRHSQNHPQDGGWIESRASSRAYGDRYCYSEAYAEVYVPALNIYLTASKTNDKCY
jgi:hypothetical protein